jgi:histidinol-phosphate aminotransferase
MNFDPKNPLSRRHFMRTLGAASVAATALPAFASLDQQATQQNAAPCPAPTQARGRRPGGGDGDMGERVVDPLAVVISSNENPLGPSIPAREAIAKVGALGGRYNQQYKSETVKTFSDIMGLKPGYVNFFPGSGGPLSLSIYANVSPSLPLIVGEPSYESGASAGAKMCAKVFRVPLTASGAHDVKAMVAASPIAGAYYITNPNNPTGTMTPKEDIVWLVKNKPKGSVVVIDEAYHHFSNDDSSIDLVAADQDVIVLRTFSKIYGMAGLRGGFYIAKPELQAKLGTIGVGVTTNGSGIVAISTAAAATASLQDKTLIATRRKINADIRENVLEWMDKNGYTYMKGSQANFFQVDVKRPGRQFAAQMTQEHIHIGRTWAAMPNYCRITVGTQEEMDKFKVAFKKCYETAPIVDSAHLDFQDHFNELDFSHHA